ncbi:MAG: HAMP domain-containing histidine kinase [Phyllobacteriaceae bacterium]|nr:HAMP domain-containing histidine kinase [Phyllobacteriaceae bacterium]
MLEKPQTGESGKPPQLAAKPAGDVAPLPEHYFRQSVARGLSGRLLVLTVIFVMIAEVLIFVPSVANFRNVWLQNHLDTAEAASIVYLDDSGIMLSPEAQEHLLMATQSLQVSIREGSVSRLMASGPAPGPVTEHISLGRMQPMSTLRSAFSTLLFGGERVYHVSGPMKSGEATIELVQEDKYLRNAMLSYSRNILLISLVISLITAGLVFLALYWLIVRPIIRISSNMDAFSQHPEDAALVYRPTGRNDEIGIAEARLSSLQKDLQATLRQKQHLAELGLAVSKINHDLRNILASAYLFSDRLTGVADPTVQRLAPKLVKTIDRAVEYTRSVLAYGKAVERPPDLQKHRLHALVEEVGETLSVEKPDHVEWRNAVPEDLEICCDWENLFRAVLNLCRNAVQAMEALPQDGRQPRLEIAATATPRETTIRIADTGPGIPGPAREKLFTAFQGSAKAGGTGLGLAIAFELVRGHGGSIELETTGPEGSVFRITLPADGNGAKTPALPRP